MDWMTTHSIEKIENIKPPQASELILELGLDHFLSEPQRCTLMDDKYGTSDSNGWNNGNLKFMVHILHVMCLCIFFTIHRQHWLV